MKAALAAIVATASLGFCAPAHAQLAVFDAGSYAQMIQQATTAINQLNELRTQVQQGQQLLTSLNQASNVGQIASQLGLPSLRQVLPHVGALTSAAGGDLSALGAIGERAGAIRDASRLFTAAIGDPTAVDIEASGLRAARDLALGEAVSTAGAQRLAGLQSLQSAIDAAPNARAVLDLQARAATEQAMIVNDQMRLQGLAMAQAAEDRLQAQRDRERMQAGLTERMGAFRAGFE